MARKQQRNSLLDSFGLRSLMGYGEDDTEEIKISQAAEDFIEWLEIQIKNFGEIDVEVRDGGIIKSVPTIEVEEVSDLANHFIKALQKRFIGIKIDETEAIKELKERHQV